MWRREECSSKLGKNIVKGKEKLINEIGDRIYYYLLRQNVFDPRNIYFTFMIKNQHVFN